MGWGSYFFSKMIVSWTKFIFHLRLENYLRDHPDGGTVSIPEINESQQLLQRHFCSQQNFLESTYDSWNSEFS